MKFTCDICSKQLTTDKGFIHYDVTMRASYGEWEFTFSVCSLSCGERFLAMSREDHVNLANEIMHGKPKRHSIQSAPHGSGADLREVRVPVDSSLPSENPAQENRMLALRHAGVCYYDWTRTSFR